MHLRLPHDERIVGRNIRDCSELQRREDEILARDAAFIRFCGEEPLLDDPSILSSATRVGADRPQIDIDVDNLDDAVPSGRRAAGLANPVTLFYIVQYASGGAA